MSQLYEKARTYIYRNARPLDLARFQYHFENGSKEAVLTALSSYQNEDGGFGHALEADSWNPDSAPIQIQTAIKILEEIDFDETEHPIVKGILNFLASGKCFDKHFWYAKDDYNPTAALAGFIICFADKGSTLYETGCRIVKEAYDQLVFESRKNDINTIYCYIQMLNYLKKAKETELVDLIVLETRLRGIVKRSITQDKKEWQNGYACKPSQFFNSGNSIFYQDNKEIADYECEFIRGTQLEDGSYPVPGDWENYPEEWTVGKMWQRAEMIISNLLYLKGMGEICHTYS